MSGDRAKAQGQPRCRTRITHSVAICRAERQRVAQAGGATHNAGHAVKVIGPDLPQRQPRLNHRCAMLSANCRKATSEEHVL